MYNKLKISEIGDAFVYLWYKTKINKSPPTFAKDQIIGIFLQIG